MKDTGGPAFPSLHDVRYQPHFHIEEGMTLLDWFAGMAMQGLLASTKTNDALVIAKDAYIIANAMLAQRDKE
jgi:hypothetical protein